MTKAEARLVSEIRSRVQKERAISMSLMRLLCARRDFAAHFYNHQDLVAWFAQKASVDWFFKPANCEIRFFEQA
jgi:hypothetical protein